MLLSKLVQALALQGSTCPNKQTDRKFEIVLTVPFAQPIWSCTWLALTVAEPTSSTLPGERACLTCEFGGVGSYFGSRCWKPYLPKHRAQPSLALGWPGQTGTNQQQAKSVCLAFHGKQFCASTSSCSIGSKSFALLEPIVFACQKGHRLQAPTLYTGAHTKCYNLKNTRHLP